MSYLCFFLICCYIFFFFVDSHLYAVNYVQCYLRISFFHVIVPILFPFQKIVRTCHVAMIISFPFFNVVQIFMTYFPNINFSYAVC